MLIIRVMIRYISDAFVAPCSVELEPFIVIIRAEGIIWTFGGASNCAISFGSAAGTTDHAAKGGTITLRTATIAGNTSYFSHKSITCLVSILYLLNSYPGIILSPLLKDRKEKQTEESLTFMREAQSAVPLRLRRLISLIPLFSQVKIAINS
jgi:hypothetical protein